MFFDSRKDAGRKITGHNRNRFSIDQAQAFDTVHLFSGGLRDAAGNLYGTTTGGGDTAGAGVVFKVTPAGLETVLHTFTSAPDGDAPYAGLILDSAGNLYGTTSGGGAFDWGTIFKIDNAGHLTVLYSFTGGSDGSCPMAGLIRDSAGNFYGTTQFGGTSGDGVVFRFVP